MKTLSGPKRQVGLTRLEVLVIVGVVLIGGVVLVPKWIKSKEGSKLAHCPRNLKQLGMSEKSWLLDRGGRFPWQTPASEGGSMQYAASADVFRHFQAISNEFETPKFLVCPSDASRTVASSFDRGFSNSNISYFAGLDADERNPYSVVHGDRNITGGVPTSFGLSFHSTNPPAWGSASMHRGVGNILTADGSVYALNSLHLRDLLAGATNPTTTDELRLAIPRLPGE